MAEAESWSTIKKYGLLSTTAILDLFEINGKTRSIIESQCRPESIELSHIKHGSVVIRDQKPLREATLAKLLDGMTTSEFYKLLNAKTFFWVRKERLEKLLKARAYRNSSHDVLTIDAKKLILTYENKIWLSRINSGAAIFGVGRRGIDTFKRIRDYPYEENRKKRKDDAVVELAIDYAVNDISKFTLRVDRWSKGKWIKTIWKR